MKEVLVGDYWLKLRTQDEEGMIKCQDVLCGGKELLCCDNCCLYANPKNEDELEVREVDDYLIDVELDGVYVGLSKSYNDIVAQGKVTCLDVECCGRDDIWCPDCPLGVDKEIAFSELSWKYKESVVKE